MICGGITETRAIARVVQDGREISDEYSEKVFHWTRESGDAQADAAWNAAHSGMREITLTAADVPNKAVLRCSITGTADAYGAMVADATNLGLTHQKGDLDAGHTFGVEEGNLMLYIPFVEPEALPSDPEVDATEEIPALDMDNAELSEPDAEAGGTPEEDIPETEDEGDVGDGTYIPGEEEAPDYDEPINNTPDPIYTPESAIPDEDTAKIPKGISYLLEDGELKIVMGLGDVLSAWATIYNTEPDEQLDFKYDVNGLRVQKVYTTPNVTETTDYILHGKLITHLTKKCVPSSGTATTEQLHFFYDKNSRPAMVEYNNTLYYYRHNLQGDIVEIVDDSGNPVVKYAYDAWGTPTNVEGTLKTTLGELNPFRYRGYVWDAESGLYYLETRYYNPKWQRFLNPDLILGANEDLLLCAPYSYCGNNPVNMVDDEGELPKWLKAVVAVATAVVATIVVAAAAPAAVCAASFTLAYYGMGMATATTVATVGVAAAGTVAVSPYYSDAIEATTGTNPIRDVVLNGDYNAYENYRAATHFAGVGLFSAASYSPGVCFVAGTPVSVENGLCPIERIQAGDVVWAMEPESGEKVLKRVVKTFERESDRLTHIHIQGEEIITTPEHPFYVKEHGWKMACELQTDDELIFQDGSHASPDCIEFERLDSPVKVYNFEVEDFHTYFVGVSCVLVHNTCDNYETRRHAFRAAKRANGIPNNSLVIVRPNYNKHNVLMPGRQYVFKYGNTTRVIREDYMGHTFGDGASMGPHFNDEIGNHYFWKRR